MMNSFTPFETTLPCTPIGYGEQHEGLLSLRSLGRIGHRLGRAIIVEDFDQITGLDVQFRHVLRVHLDEREGIAIHYEVVLLVEIGALPDMVGAPIIDEEPELLRFLFFAGGLQPTPFRLVENGLAVFGVELAIGIETLGADDAF